MFITKDVLKFNSTVQAKSTTTQHEKAKRPVPQPKRRIWNQPYFFMRQERTALEVHGRQ